MATTTAIEETMSPIRARLFLSGSLSDASATMETIIVGLPRMITNQLSQPRHGISPINVMQAATIPKFIATRGSGVFVEAVCAGRGAGGYGAGYCCCW